MVKPYEDHQCYGMRHNSWYRIIKRNAPTKSLLSSDLVWHRDQADRHVRVVHGNGWKFQFDENLPILLSEGDEITIKKGVYHRLIMGDDDLVLKIEET